MVNAGKSITLIWIPGHTGIRGNERADEAANAVLSSTISTMKCSASDLNPELAKHYRNFVNSGRPNGIDAVLINYSLSNATLVTVASHISVIVMLLF